MYVCMYVCMHVCLCVCIMYDGWMDHMVSGIVSIFIWEQPQQWILVLHVQI